MGNRYQQASTKEEIIWPINIRKITPTSNWRHMNKIMIDDFSPKNLIEKLWGDSHSHKLLKI